jgi:hypothetical protein
VPRRTIDRHLKLTSLTSLLAVGLLFGTASPTAAIIGGAPDDHMHRYVAGIQQPDGRGVVFTGVLIAPRVVLTAGHGALRLLAAGFTTARVTFDPVATDGATWYMGTIHLNPGYDPNRLAVGDFAVILFDEDIPGIQPALLPSAGQLESLPSAGADRSQLSVVGYGLTRLLGGAEGGGRPAPDFTSGGTRMVDAQRFLSLSPTWLWLEMKDADMVCIGDSGAPSLIAGSSVVAGITIGSLGLCTSAVLDMRLDTPSARAFLAEYVTLP